MRTGARSVWRALVWIAMIGMLVAGFVSGHLIMGEMLGQDLGVLAAVFVYGLVQAVLPLWLRPPFLAGIEPTQAVRRGAADRLVRALHLGGRGGVDADLARLDAGARLYLLCYGDSVRGSLLLRRLPDGTADVAWRPRKGRVVVPVAQGPACTVSVGAVQQNRMQARLGMTCSVQLGDRLFWVRALDADLLRAVFASEPAAAAEPAAPSVTA